MNHQIGKSSGSEQGSDGLISRREALRRAVIGGGALMAGTGLLQPLPKAEANPLLIAAAVALAPEAIGALKQLIVNFMKSSAQTSDVNSKAITRVENQILGTDFIPFNYRNLIKEDWQTVHFGNSFPIVPKKDIPSAKSIQLQMPDFSFLLENGSPLVYTPVKTVTGYSKKANDVNAREMQYTIVAQGSNAFESLVPSGARTVVLPKEEQRTSLMNKMLETLVNYEFESTKLRNLLRDDYQASYLRQMFGPNEKPIGIGYAKKADPTKELFWTFRTAKPDRLSTSQILDKYLEAVENKAWS